MIIEDQYKSILERIEAMEAEIKSLKEENEILSDKIHAILHYDIIHSYIHHSDILRDSDQIKANSLRQQFIEEDEKKRRLAEEQRRNEEAIVKLRRERDKKYTDSDEDAVIVSESTCEIDDNAFFNRMFTSLTIPSSVKKIGSKFCFHCTMLRTVKFLGSCPEGLEQAFDECWRLKEIIVPEAELENFKTSLLPEYDELIRSF